ncbi:MAG: PilZ domain-containing protein [Deltaproteobacteria bacterium]|nr:PilZ domain-containing protein [Deltaproteobacteria bacterium]
MEISGQLTKKSGVTAQLIERIKNMSLDQQVELLKALDKSSKEGLRQSYRKNFFMIIDYNVEGQYFRDFIQDINEGGLFIETYQKFSAGQSILMSFMSPEFVKPFKIGGEIVHVRPYGFGVKFKIENQVQEEAIKNLVNMIQDR